METLWQTSATRLAVRSRWRIDGKPPKGQERVFMFDTELMMFHKCR